jgi:crotonobetainyl-CoA:carnitine CoA-transferase CaiB-like acyl-CoA transferase
VQSAPKIRPLEGVTVLDFTTLLPGPLATLTLADAGARVIKIEPIGGEAARHLPPFLGDPDQRISAPHAILKRGKTVMELDMRDAAARDAILALVGTTDVVVEQFRPGVMKRLGLDHAALRKINPRLVYCSISSYGQEGPSALEPGHDLNYQARAGVLSLSPGPLERPTLPPVLTADIGAGTLPAIFNIMLALFHRERTGEGAYLDMAIADGLFAFATPALWQGRVTGEFPRPGEARLSGGLPRYDLYATRDDRLVAVAALEEKFWRNFCDLIDLPEALRRDHDTPAETRRAVAERIRRRTAAEWGARFVTTDCCANVVATLEEALRDPQFLARGLFSAVVPVSKDETAPAAVTPLAPIYR